jgi:hypothetical protein
VSEVRASTDPEEGLDSPSTVDPSLVGATTTGVHGLALAPQGEEVRPSEGPFVWPHVMDPREACWWCVTHIINRQHLHKILAYRHQA